jgi:heptosyltransferase-2
MKKQYQVDKKTLPNGDQGSFLVIKPGAIGDVLQMTPVVRAIKRHFHGSRLLFLMGNQATFDLLENNPHVDEIVLFPKGRGLKELCRVLGLAGFLKKKGIYCVINYQPSNWRWRILTFFLRPGRVLLYKKQKRVKRGEMVRHAVEDHLRTLSGLGIKEEAHHLDLFLTDQELREAEDIIEKYKCRTGYRGMICLNMGASHPVNRWPVEAFHKLNSILISEGFKTILIGGAEDRCLVDQFFRIGHTEVLDLVGSLSIRKTAAILSQSDALVTGDTGPLHLATSVGTKVVALFGAADPERTGPIGLKNIVIQPDLPCVPCRKRKCPNGQRACMEAIDPEVVASHVRALIEDRHPEKG